ncbi:MAG: ribosome-binding factor A, partial [Xylophilus sp.]|nr:ribosome-binding factor A [Xylophilus sp.]
MPKKKAATPNRAFKVADQIQRDLSELIARELKDPRV